MEIIKDTDSSLEVVERVADQSPKLVIVSHLPPEGSTLARYLVRRLRAQFAELPIVVGRWGGETDGSARAVERMVEVGASRVLVSLFDARAHVLSMAVAQRKTAAMASAVSE
jgi:methylmalonyl-CoA mutase cobalamin-binding subunit